MTRLLLDVNVVLDFVLNRDPFAGAATALLAAAERGHAEVRLPAHGVTTVFYIVARQRGPVAARRIVADFLLLAQVAPVNDAVVRRALALGWPDFEDAVCAAAGEGDGCDLLVTRDPSGFEASPVLAVDPVTALALVEPAPGGPGEVAEGRATDQATPAGTSSFSGTRASAFRAKADSTRPRSSHSKRPRRTSRAVR